MAIRRFLIGLAASPCVACAAPTAVIVPPPNNPPHVADRAGAGAELALEPAPATRPAFGVDLMPVWPLQLPPPPMVDDLAAAYRSLVAAHTQAAAAQAQAQAQAVGDAALRERLARDSGDVTPALSLQWSPWGWNWGLSWAWSQGPGLSLWWPAPGLQFHGPRRRR